MAIQLQPQLSLLSRWEELAEREGFAFEVLEPFGVPVISYPEKRKDIVRQYLNTGRARSLHGAFIDVNPASSDPEMAALSRRRCEESCQVAIELGAENVVFHSGAFPFLRGAYMENWTAVSADFYQQLSEKYPVNIYIENAQDIDPEPLRRLMERISSPRVGICLDVGHANYSHAPMEQWFDQLADRIGYMHLSDNMGRFDDHLPLGRGTVDWAKLHDLWLALGRDIPITLETGGLESTIASIDFLRSGQYFALGGTQHG